MKVKDVAEVNQLSITTGYPHSEIEYIDTSSVTEGKFDPPQRFHIKDAPSRARRIVHHNDILISTVRPNLKHYGICKKPSDNTVASTGFAVISCKKIFPDYLYRLLTTNWYTEFLAAIAESQQSNFPAFNPALIENSGIAPPSIDIQKKVAAILSAYDELIENNRRRITLLEKMVEEIYREWFVRMRFPGHGNVKKLKGVPSGWEVRPLSGFASEIKRGVKKRNLSDDEKYMGLEHIPRRSISIKEWATANTVDSDKLLFQERDILFGKIRPYLHKVALAHFSGACSSDTIVLRPKEKIYEGYLLFTVFSDTFIELATVASKGTKMPRADWGFLKKLELAVPDEKLLEAFQAQFEVLFSQIVNLLRVNELLTSSRDQLLPRLISGKLSVEHLDIQFPPGMEGDL